MDNEAFERERDKLMASQVDPELEAIRYNLSLTPLERLEKHRRAMESVEKLRDAGIRYRRSRNGN